MYDTFHEPFKRVVPSYPAVPETSTQNNAEVGSANEDKKAKEEKEEKDKEKESKRRKKEPQLTVKSALSAAFSKYANKVGKKNNKSQGEGREETSAATEQEAEIENL